MLAGLLSLCLAACGSFTYEGTPLGKLRGQLLVIWVGEDRFVYWPLTKDPLTFTLGLDLQQKLGIQTIRPGLMYTDGGSIPRPLPRIAPMVRTVEIHSHPPLWPAHVDAREHAAELVEYLDLRLHRRKTRPCQQKSCHRLIW